MMFARSQATQAETSGDEIECQVFDDSGLDDALARSSHQHGKPGRWRPMAAVEAGCSRLGGASRRETASESSVFCVRETCPRIGHADIPLRRMLRRGPTFRWQRVGASEFFECLAKDLPHREDTAEGESDATHADGHHGRDLEQSQADGADVRVLQRRALETQPA